MSGVEFASRQGERPRQIFNNVDQIACVDACVGSLVLPDISMEADSEQCFESACVELEDLAGSSG